MMKKETKAKVINNIITILSVVMFILCFETWRGRGILYWLLGMTLILLTRLWIRRDALMNLIRYTETVLYGKPLDKDLWEKGEFKKVKVKFVLKKKKETEKNESKK